MWLSEGRNTAFSTCLLSWISSRQTVRSAVKVLFISAQWYQKVIVASILLSFYEVPSTVPHLMFIVPFNPFRYVADEKT